MLGHGDAWQRVRWRVWFALSPARVGSDSLGHERSGDANQLRPWVAVLGWAINSICSIRHSDSPFRPRVVEGLRRSSRCAVILTATLARYRHGIICMTTPPRKPRALPRSWMLPWKRSRTTDASLGEWPVGDRQLRLTIEPSEQAEWVRRKVAGIANVMLWLVPIEASLSKKLSTISGSSTCLPPAAVRRTALLENRTIVSQARYKHLRGIFSNSQEKQGAKSLYIDARIPDAEIDSLATNERLQEQMPVCCRNSNG